MHDDPPVARALGASGEHEVAFRPRQRVRARDAAELWDGHDSQGEDHVANVGSEEDGEREGQDQRGDREHHVERSRDPRVGPVPVVTAEQSERATYHEAERDRAEPDEQ